MRFNRFICGGLGLLLGSSVLACDQEEKKEKYVPNTDKTLEVLKTEESNTTFSTTIYPGNYLLEAVVTAPPAERKVLDGRYGKTKLNYALLDVEYVNTFIIDISGPIFYLSSNNSTEESIELISQKEIPDFPIGSRIWLEASPDDLRPFGEYKGIKRILRKENSNPYSFLHSYVLPDSPLTKDRVSN